MGIFKAIKNFFTGASVEAPFEPETKVAPTMDTTNWPVPSTNWPFPTVRPEDTTATSEVAIKPAPKKKRPAKPKADAAPAPKAEAPKANKPKTAPKAKPAAIKAAPATSTSKRVRKTRAPKA
jgi:hypothetical protein